MTKGVPYGDNTILPKNGPLAAAASDFGTSLFSLQALSVRRSVCRQRLPVSSQRKRRRQRRKRKAESPENCPLRRLSDLSLADAQKQARQRDQGHFTHCHTLSLETSAAKKGLGKVLTAMYKRGRDVLAKHQAPLDAEQAAVKLWEGVAPFLSRDDIMPRGLCVETLLSMPPKKPGGIMQVSAHSSIRA